MGVKEDLRIDPNNLDVEWGTLPELFHHYSEELDVAEANIRKMKMKLEYIGADLDRDIRKNPKDYTDQAKLTENQIKALIQKDNEYRELQEEILNKEVYKKSISSVCRALEFKKDALKQMVTLFTSEYYSTNMKTTGDNSDYLKKQEETSRRTVQHDIKKRMRRKKKENKDG